MNNQLMSFLWSEHFKIKRMFLFIPKLLTCSLTMKDILSSNLYFASQKNGGDTGFNNNNNDKGGGSGYYDNNEGEAEYSLRQKIGLVLGPLLFFLILIMPKPADMTYEAQKMAAIAILMATWWICESIPIPATSLLPLVLMPAFGIMGVKKAGVPYASDIIFLYMGGFIIALSMQRWNLHRRIALNTIRLIGYSPRRLMLGFMIATAGLSAFVSNTATTVMMLPIGLAIIFHVVEEGKKEGIDKKIDFRLGKFNFGTNLMLGIAYSASVGGIATLIGTPPNAILAGFLNETYGFQITFYKWLFVGVPLVLIMIPTIWLILMMINPIALKKIPGGREIIRDELNKIGRMNKGEKYTAIIFGLTALSWIFRKQICMFFPEPSMISDGSIAITGAILLFLIPIRLNENIFTMNWEWANKLPWGVLILFGGGLSMAVGIRDTELAKWIASQVGLLAGAPLWLLLLAVTTLVIFLTEMTSNTATTAMLMPILAAVAIGLGENPLLLLIPAAISASCAFMLPVATPPNAIVYGSGYITIPQMAKNGFWLNIIGIIFVIILTFILVVPVFDVIFGELPGWILIK
ncbi:MAG: DASS family sodium-coupled anion symporter [Deferribacterota bacterium]|nr:DASS family sodium-coupled anion symporter [Deferribacterota bacterium]